MWTWAAAYLVLINALAFGLFALDKRRAEARARRIPERTLLLAALAGGTPGAMAAQQLLRHKTRKQPFRTWLWLIWAVQAAGLAAFALRGPIGALIARGSALA
jgi:uncharacterized membrane protein YsdA (DUF1294 family)